MSQGDALTATGLEFDALMPTEASTMLRGVSITTAGETTTFGMMRGPTEMADGVLVVGYSQFHQSL